MEDHMLPKPLSNCFVLPSDVNANQQKSSIRDVFCKKYAHTNVAVGGKHPKIKCSIEL